LAAEINSKSKGGGGQNQLLILGNIPNISSKLGGGNPTKIQGGGSADILRWAANYSKY
jgi:hypothetical protein